MAAENGNPTDYLVEQEEGVEAAVEEATGPPQQGVYGRLFREGYQFDFYQAVRLLERYFPDAPPPGEVSEVRRERIFFRPHVGLSFPATDVRHVDLDEEARAELTVTFLGLYGIDSPLPVYFYDELTTEEPETYPLRDFLDIFNHRLYAYFYRAWKKYRPELRHERPEETRQGRRFLSIAGLATSHALDRAPLANRMRLAAFAGRLAPHARNAEGLRALLSGFLEGVGVRVEENVPRWVPIPSRPSMGQGGGLALGSTATIGERVFDMAGKIRIVLGPISFTNFETYLPGGEKARLVQYLVRLYTPDYLDYDVELHLSTDGIPPVRLGEGMVRLGQTAWLGKPAEAITVQHLVY